MDGHAEKKEFPHLKEFCGEHLWAPSCYHVSVGNGWEIVKEYISGQDTHHAKSDRYRPRSSTEYVTEGDRSSRASIRMTKTNITIETKKGVRFFGNQ